MSNSTFLQKMRKGDLAKMAESLSLDIEGLKKSQLETLIEAELTAHSHYAADSRYAGYYKRRLTDISSPIKREAEAVRDGVVDAVNAVATSKPARTARRRVKEPVEEAGSALEETDTEQPIPRTRALTTRTPNRVRELAASVPLPPSPSVVTDVIERRTAALRSRLSEVASNSGVIEAAESTRDIMSSTVTIEALTLLFEFYHLRPEILADRYAFDFPAIPLLTAAPHPVWIPDVFLLLTARFWSPFLLWVGTSLFVPLLFAYFFNLTARSRRGVREFGYRFDPLTFNIVKAVVAYAVYAQDVTFGGIVDLESVARIRSALAGGWQGVVAGAAIGVLVTFYEAIIRK